MRENVSIGQLPSYMEAKLDFLVVHQIFDGSWNKNELVVEGIQLIRVMLFFCELKTFISKSKGSIISLLD